MIHNTCLPFMTVSCYFGQHEELQWSSSRSYSGGCWLESVVWWHHPAVTTVITMQSVKAMNATAHGSAPVFSHVDYWGAWSLKNGNPPPPQLWNSSEGKVTVTINTRGCLVQLECIRLISQLPDSGTIASIATRESDGKILNTVSVLQSNYWSSQHVTVIIILWFICCQHLLTTVFFSFSLVSQWRFYFS